jgi:hypothetical protein
VAWDSNSRSFSLKASTAVLLFAKIAAARAFIQDARLRSLPSRQLPYVWQNSLSQGETASGVIAAGIFHNEFDPKHKFYKAGKIPFST